MKCPRCGKDNPPSVHTCSPLALKLADLLDLLWLDGQTPRKAAAELRRLHAENEALREALHQISLCSQNSMSSLRQCGEIARAALAQGEKT
jgi:hypothetical protein